MRRLLLTISFTLALCAGAHAQTKISALPSGTPVSTDVVPYVADPSGTPVTKKTTVADLFSWFTVTPSAVPSANKNGNGSKFQLFAGSMAAGDCAKFDASGNLVTNGGTCAAAAPVQSVFGRSGAVTAQAGDYTWAQIDKATSSLADITTRSASDLTSGTLGAARMPALTGDVTTSAGSVATAVANDAVTYAKMQNVSAASRLLGRGDSGSGDPQEITLGAGLTMTGTTLSASGGGGAATTAAAYRSTNQSIPNGSVDTVITLDSEYHDTFNGHSTASNTSRVTVATSGYYRVTFCAQWNLNTTGTFRILRLKLNGSTDLAAPFIGSAGTYTSGCALATRYLSAGDYVEGFAAHDATAALDLLSNSSSRPTLTVDYLGS